MNHQHQEDLEQETPCRKGTKKFYLAEAKWNMEIYTMKISYKGT